MSRKSKKKQKHDVKSSPVKSSKVLHLNPEPNALSFGKIPWYTWAGLCLIGLAVYLNTFRNAFIWDDLIIIPTNPYIADWHMWPKLFITDVHHFAIDKSNFYRPLQMLSYAINYSLAGLRPPVYHVTQSLIHMGNACLIGLLFTRAGERGGLASSTAMRAAFAAAVLWLVHPIHTQCTTYVSGRADLLVTTFILLTLWAHITRKSPLLTAAFLIGGLMSKEMAVITPLLMLMSDAVLRRSSGEVKGVWQRYLPVGLVFCVYAILRLTVFNFDSAFSTEHIPGLVPRVLTSFKAVTILWGSLLFPAKLSMIRNIPFVYSLSDMTVWLSLFLVSGSLVWAYVCRQQRPMVTFGLAWFFCAYLPVSNIIPMNANVSEHWMYLPCIGLIYVIVLGLNALIKKPFVFGLIVACLAVPLAIRLVVRNTDFKDEKTFYLQTLKTNPHNARINYNLGTAFAFDDQLDKAEGYFDKAIQFDPDYAEAYGNLGLIYARRGELEKAIEFHEKARSLKTGLIENTVNLGNAYASKKDGKRAMVVFEEALAMNPHHVGAINGYGIELAKAGQYDAAEKYFTQALTIDPANGPAQNNLQRLKAIRQQRK